MTILQQASWHRIPLVSCCHTVEVWRPDKHRLKQKKLDIKKKSCSKYKRNVSSVSLSSLLTLTGILASYNLRRSYILGPLRKISIPSEAIICNATKRRPPPTHTHTHTHTLYRDTYFTKLPHC